MSCTWQGKLDPYVDAELPQDELAEVEAHLQTCPSCAAAALSRLQLKRMTHAAGAMYSPRPEFRLKIQRMAVNNARSSWRLNWMPKFALAGAAVVLLAVFGGVWMRHAQRQQAFGELADLHVSVLASANPVDVISSDRHTVKPWFQGKLAFSFDLPELQNSPFVLLGGRLVYFEQNPAAQLLYEVRKHRISVFIFQDRAAFSRLNSGHSAFRKMAFNMETWTSDGLRYVVVGDAGPAEIHDLSELLRQAARS